MKLVEVEIDLLLLGVCHMLNDWADQLDSIRKQKDEYDIKWHSFPKRDQDSPSYQYLMNIFNQKIKKLEDLIHDGNRLASRLATQKELLHQKEEQGGEANVEER